MIELKQEKVNTVITTSPTVEVPTNQQQQIIDKSIILGELKGQNWKPNLNLNDSEKKEVAEYKKWCEKNPKLITLKGITTSQINQALKGKKTNGFFPYPARVFLKVDNQEQDIPIFFRIKEKDYQVKPCSECNYPKKGNWEKQTNCQTKEAQHQIKEVWIRPKIKKGSYLQVQGHFDNPINGSSRKSFTATSYQLLNQKLTQKIETHGK